MLLPLLCAQHVMLIIGIAVCLLHQHKEAAQSAATELADIKRQLSEVRRV